MQKNSKESNLFNENEIMPVDKRDLMAFFPSVFIMSALPLKDVKKSVFTRKYNDISLTINNYAITEDDNKKRVPYGKYARLVLALLTTKAKIHSKEDKVVVTYKNIQELLDEMQLPRQRGKDILEQLELFLSSQFVFSGRIKNAAQKSLFREFEDFQDPVKVEILNTNYIPFCTRITTINTVSSDNKKNKAISFELAPQFVDLCEKHAVPINYTVYKEINSIIGKDLYVWLLYRNNFIKEGEPLFISRKALVDQFCDVTDPEDKDEFNNNFYRLKDIIYDLKNKYMPELKYNFDDSGLNLYKSDYVILPGDRRYILISQVNK